MGQASQRMIASHRMVQVLATEQQHKLRIMNCEEKTCYLTFSVIYLLCLITFSQVIRNLFLNWKIQLFVLSFNEGTVVSGNLNLDCSNSPVNLNITLFP